MAETYVPTGINVEQLSLLTPEQQTLLSGITEKAGAGGVSITPPGGLPQQRAVGLDPLQQQAYTTAQQYSTDPTSPWAQARDVTTGAISQMGEQYVSPGAAQVGAAPGAVDVGTWDPGAERAYWEEAVRDPMMQEWQSTVAPAISERFIAQGAGSSGGQRRAIAESGRRLSQETGGVLADLLFRGQQAQKEREITAGENYATRVQENLGRQLTSDEAELARQFEGFDRRQGRVLESAQTLAPQLYGQSVEELGVLESLGAGRRAAAQQAEDVRFGTEQTGYEAWLAEQPWKNPWLDMAFTPGIENVAMAAYGTPAGTPETTPAWLQDLIDAGTTVESPGDRYDLSTGRYITEQEYQNLYGVGS